MSASIDFVRIVNEIRSKATPYVRGCITGLLDTATIIPSAAMAVHPVKFVEDDNGQAVSGYVFSILSSIEETKLPFEVICERAILQRIVVMENDYAVNYLKYGEQGPVSSYLQ